MNEERSLKVILGPIVSEKSTEIADSLKQFVFRVIDNATKLEVKRAVESLFKVEVAKVNVLNVKGKTKNFKQISGKRRNFKKAYVTLKPGQDINFATAFESK